MESLSNHIFFQILSSVVQDFKSRYLNAWVGSVIVWASFSGYAARWTTLTFVPEAHASLFWLLEDLNTGVSHCTEQQNDVSQIQRFEHHSFKYSNWLDRVKSMSKT